MGGVVVRGFGERTRDRDLISLWVAAFSGAGTALSSSFVENQGQTCLAGLGKLTWGLVGGFGSSISVRGLAPGTPAKLKQVYMHFPILEKLILVPWKPNESLELRFSGSAALSSRSVETKAKSV